MNNLNNEIKDLKSFIEKRETYIRFSPIGTIIVGFIFILYYFFSSKISFLPENYLFFVIGAFSFFLVTILSLLNSFSKNENSLPKSIRNIILNLFVVWLTFFVIVFSIENISIDKTKSFALIFYGLLIILSRYNINIFVRNFGFFSFILGITSLFFFKNFVNEILLVVLGIGHIFMGILLKINNK